MAEETSLEIEDTSKGKKKLIIIAVSAVIIAAVVGYFLLSGGDEQVETLADEPNLEQNTTPSSSTATVKLGSALYVAMPRPFIFNVPGAGRDRIVQIKVQLLVRGEVNEETAKKHIPLIESTLLSVLSTTTADELGTSQGKETVRIAALEKVQSALSNVEGSKVIERVLFTGFVMQ
ncbi:flagellar basal body-associated protein FliL [Pseudoalteromonas mariniglutinosa]|uniref:flagellar basal body-associated protein FliL n=1 Tax=Pseudoalteromonas mariniglutinosa TaxID=206042 RepID=UPI00384BB1BB